MCDDEAQNHERVVAKGVEFGVGERENDRKNGPGNVPEEEGKESWDLPVLATADDEIEVAAELVTLVGNVSMKRV